MMKWMTIGAGCIIGGMLGWNIGHRFFSTNMGLIMFLVCGMAMVGTWIAWKMTQDAL